VAYLYVHGLFILRFFGHCINIRTLTALASCLLNGVHPFYVGMFGAFISRDASYFFH
jgi:hypothetical protein